MKSPDPVLIPVTPHDPASVTVTRSTLVYTFLLGAAVTILIQWSWTSAMPTSTINTHAGWTNWRIKKEAQFHSSIIPAATHLGEWTNTRTDLRLHGDDLPAAYLADIEGTPSSFLQPTTDGHSSTNKCYHLSDLPSTMTPIRQSSTWGRISLTPYATCPGLGNGVWKIRPNSDIEPTWLSVDRWGMFGTRGSLKDVQYEYHDQCKLRRFDASTFLRAMRGKTIAFLGDSLIRQQFGMLTLLLDEAIVGSQMFYTPTARSFDPVREVYLAHDITLKNQWLSGSHGLVRDVFPTIWRSDILVVNVGAFFESSEENKFNATLTNFIDWTKKHYKGTVIWREYSATHFDTVDGEFDPSLKSSSCRRYDPSNTRQLHRHNYRVELANAIMRQHRIPVLPAFQSSLTYFSTLTPEIVQPHPGDQTNGDCRHWYAPSSPLIQWNEVLYNFIVPN